MQIGRNCRIGSHVPSHMITVCLSCLMLILNYVLSSQDALATTCDGRIEGCFHSFTNRCNSDSCKKNIPKPTMIDTLPRRQSLPLMDPRLFKQQQKFVVVAIQKAANLLQNLVHLRRSSGLDLLYMLAISTGPPQTYQQLSSRSLSHTSQQVFLLNPSLEHRLPYHGTAWINLHSTVGHLYQPQHILHLMRQVR